MNENKKYYWEDEIHDGLKWLKDLITYELGDFANTPRANILVERFGTLEHVFLQMQQAKKM